MRGSVLLTSMVLLLMPPEAAAQNRKYGYKRAGKSRFVIVAPHGVYGDDDHTAELAERIATQLHASVVVNTTFVKPGNTHASRHPVEDFNRLSWSGTRKRYRWSEKAPEMREFYKDVEKLCEGAREHGDGTACVIYIHGMGKNPGIDIGFGAKYHDGRLKGTRGVRDKHPGSGNNGGVVRAKRRDVVKLAECLNRELEPLGEPCTIGQYWAGWSRTNGIQFHAGTPDHSMQLEISAKLRSPQMRHLTVEAIADALVATYGE